MQSNLNENGILILYLIENITYFTFRIDKKNIVLELIYLQKNNYYCPTKQKTENKIETLPKITIFNGTCKRNLFSVISLCVYM